MKRSIAYVQIIVGIFVILASIFSYFYLVGTDRQKEIYYQAGVSAWLKMGREQNITITPKEKLMMASAVPGDILNAYAIITAASALGLILGIMFIFQGLASLNYDSKQPIKKNLFNKNNSYK
jgi:uncharacterized membrane protein HdeD (DUF308 family)